LSSGILGLVDASTGAAETPVAITGNPVPADYGSSAAGEVQQNNDPPNTTNKDTTRPDEGQQASQPQSVSGAFLTDGAELTGAKTKSMSFNDPVQGTSATCGITASLSAAALSDFDLESGIRLQSQVAPNDAIYLVRLFKTVGPGLFQPDWISVEFNGTIQPADAHQSDPREFWATLYQRAYLTLMQQEGLDYQVTDNALEALTGQTDTEFAPNLDPLSQASQILAALDQGSPVVADTNANGPLLLNGGMIHDHAYTVLGVEIAPSGSSSGIFVTLRNPWGSDTDWTYFEKDHDGTLNEAEWVQYDHGLDGNNDGVVRIPWSTFAQDFTNVVINHVTGPVPTNFPQVPQPTPTFNYPNPGPITVYQGQSVGPLDLSATDPNGHALFYSLTLDDPGYVNPLSGQYYWEPTASDSPGTYTITVVAEESEYTPAAVETVEIDVVAGAPTINSLAASPTSISNAGTDLLTLTPNGVADSFGQVDFVEYWHALRGDPTGAFDPTADIELGVANSGANGWTWSGYVGGLQNFSGSLNFFAVAGRYSFNDTLLSAPATFAVNVTPAPIVEATAVPTAKERGLTPYEFYPEYGDAFKADDAGNVRLLWTGYSSTPAVNTQEFDQAGNALTSFVPIAGAYGAQDFAPLSGSGFAPVWASASGLVEERFDSGANPIGSPVVVDPNYSADNAYIQMAADQHGNVLIVYQKGGYLAENVFAATVSSDGRLTMSPWMVNAPDSDAHRFPTVALDSSGAGVIAWADLTGSIVATKVSAAGLVNGPDFTVCPGAANANFPIGAATNSSGGFTITWTSDAAPALNPPLIAGIYARRYDDNAKPLGNAFVVNTFHGGSQDTPRVATNDEGWTVIAWESYGQDAGDTLGESGTYAQIFDPQGVADGPEFPVPTYIAGSQTPIGVTFGDDGLVDVAMTQTGPFTWDLATVDFRQFQVAMFPVFAAAPSFSLPENSAAGTVVGTLAATDPDGESCFYTLLGSSPFAVNAQTGVVTLKNASALSTGTKKFVMTAEATGEGNPELSTLTPMTVTVTHVDSAPVVQAVAFSIPANSRAGVLAGLVTAIDKNPGRFPSFSLVGASPFSIDSYSGVVTVTGSTLLHVGSYQVKAQATDGTGLSGTKLFSVTVVQATPTVTWANPADIVYGTALSASQLDATTGVPGTFTYSPAVGTILHAGNNQAISVTFTPKDRIDYASASAVVKINVTRAKPTITWTDPADITTGTPLGAGQLDATAPVSGVFTYTPAAGSILNVGANQALAVSFTPADKTDYNTATASARINVIALPPPPSPHVTGVVSVTRSKKGLTSITVGFNEALLAESVILPSHYSVFGAAKKRGKTVYTKGLGKWTISFDGHTKVTIKLAKPYKGTLRVTVRGGVLAADGASSSGDFAAIVV
jgi:hypothetical protein